MGNTEQANIKVMMNGQQAAQELKQLETYAKELRKELRQLKISGDTKGAKKLEKEIKSVNIEMREVKKQAFDVENVLKNLNGASLSQLRTSQRKINKELANMTRGTNEYINKSKQLKLVKNELAKIRQETALGSKGISKFTNGFNKYFAVVTTGFAALTGVVFSIKQMLDGNAKLSDSFADVAKTTGLTTKEVKELSKQLKKLDTRSSQKELLGLAEIAGKLGVKGKANILGFVKSADKLNVALGEDLGGDVEQTIKQVGKLVEIFGVSEDFGLEKGLLKVGSAINSLGAASTASEGYLVEFTKRVGGVAKQSKTSIQDILGLGATLDQLGQTSEVSATTYNKVVMDMFKNTSEYANMAGMSVTDFSTLLNEDSNEAFIKFLEGLNGNNEGLTVMSKKLDTLGLDGARSAGVLATLAKNTEMLKEQQTLSNQEFTKGSSLTEEFNTKNTNLAATLDKISKRLRGMFMNSSIVNGIKTVVGYIERWTKTPLSKTLESERIELRKLESKLTDTNLKHADKVKLINELKTQYPSYLKNINAETVSNEQLKNSLREINDMLINKIILQKEDEKIEEQNRITAEKRMAVIEQEDAVRERMIKLQEKYNIQLKGEGTLIEKAIAVWNYAQKQQKTQGGILIDNVAKFNHEISELQALNQQLNSYEEAAERAIEAKEKLKNRLGIKDNAAPSVKPIEPDTVDPITPTGDDDNNDDTKAEAKAKADAEFQQRQSEIARLYGLEVEYLKNRKSATQKFFDWQKEYKKKQLLDDRALMTKAVDDLNYNYSVQLIELETTYKQQLALHKDNEDEKKQITETYNEKSITLQEAHLTELIQLLSDQLNQTDLHIDLLPEDAIKEYKKKIAELKLQLANIKVTPTKEPTPEGSGETCENEEKYLVEDECRRQQYDKILAETQELANAQMQLMQEVNNFQNQLAKKEINDLEKNTNDKIAILEAEKEKELELLKEQLNKGLIDEREYNNRKEEIDQKYADSKTDLDDKLAQKKEDLAKEQFERDKTYAIVQAIISTALGIARSLDKGMPQGAALAALSAAAGAVQISTIEAQEYALGKYDVLGENSGKTYSATYAGNVKTGLYTEPTLGLFAEEGNEIVIDGPTTSNIMMNAPEILDAINYMRVPQYATGKNVDTAEINDTNKPLQDMDAMLKVLSAIHGVISTWPKEIKAIIEQDTVFDIRNEIYNIDEIEKRVSA